jgi:hypothetical protein
MLDKRGLRGKVREGREMFTHQIRKIMARIVVSVYCCNVCWVLGRCDCESTQTKFTVVLVDVLMNSRSATCAYKM